MLSGHGYDLVRVPSGEFLMGSPEGESGRDDDERQHRVVLTRGFLLGRTEVTQALYASVMGSTPSDHEVCVECPVERVCAECPVERVSWLAAVAFCNRLSEQEGLPPAYGIRGDSVSWDRSSTGYRLPTEAEWEYAARAGGSTLYSGSNRLGDVGWYDNNSGSETHPVGELAENAWGLEDMSGNVWEWVWDAYDQTYPSTVEDPVVRGGAFSRVSRGGSWRDNARNSRVATRHWGQQSFGYVAQGFRLARSE